MNKDFNIQEELKLLPDKPGVYLMHGENDEIIYVGKAKILKNRVKSYFVNTPHSAHITVMISQITRFEYVVCDSEYEALLLENNLIKKHKPKYNVLLKDDKGFPYIKVTTNEDYPRVMMVRKVRKDGATYFGPYHSVQTINSTLDALKSILPLRLCNKKIRPDGNDRVCLNYHIGLCPGICAGKIKYDEYMKTVSMVLSFLSGNTKEIEQKLREKMLACATDLNFEMAAVYRKRLETLEVFKESQKITSVNDADYDMIAVGQNGVDAVLQIFFIRAGNVSGREYFTFPGGGDLYPEEITVSFIKQFYGENQLIPPRIYTKTLLPDEERTGIEEMLSNIRGKKCEIATPMRGEKLKLAQMVEQNANIVLQNAQIAGLEGRNVENLKTLDRLRQVLQLQKMPLIIEAYDISNLGSSEINASMVVFRSGTASKKDYKLFKIKSLDIQNDYASMEEVLTRRFTRLKEGSHGFTDVPDVIFIDGGIGQVRAAQKALANIDTDIAMLPVFGMEKDDRHRTKSLIIPEGDDNYTEYELKKDPELWRFVGSVQNEAHRFAIEYNRKLTKKRYRKSILDDIPGVGEKRKLAIYKHFGSLTAIKNATCEEIASVPGIGKAAACVIYNHINGDAQRREP